MPQNYTQHIKDHEYVTTEFYACAGAGLAFNETATAGEVAKPKTDVIPGIWRGYITSSNQGHQIFIDVRKAGNGYGGVAMIWAGISEEQARAAIRGAELPVAMLSSASVCYQESFVITVEGETLTFKSTGVQTALKSKAKIEPDLLTGKLNPIGVASGELSDGKKKVGVFELAKEEIFKTPLPLDIEKGKTVKLGCVDGGDYHYSIYLPKAYDPAKTWPVVINFSPGGNANPLSPKLADEFGWIMLGLTESKNGDWGPIIQNRDTVLFDLHRRFNIDWKHVYFSGFSGGARASSGSALTYPDSCAGVLLCCAAYGSGPPNSSLPIYFITGNTDSNVKEVEQEYEAAKKVGRKTSIGKHTGGHEWGPPEFAENGLKWLEQETGAKKVPAKDAPVKK